MIQLPILVNDANTIIDGNHRWYISAIISHNDQDQELLYIARISLFKYQAYRIIDTEKKFVMMGTMEEINEYAKINNFKIEKGKK